MTSPNLPEPSQAPNAAPENSHDVLWQNFLTDPEGYLKGIISSVIQHEMMLLREEMQFRTALSLARQRYPELAQLEGYLMQELVSILEASPDEPAQSWDSLVDKSLQQLQGKFKSVAGQPATPPPAENSVLMESASVRQPQSEPLAFSREQLAKMSMPEFLQFEAAINEALRQKRIR